MAKRVLNSLGLIAAALLLMAGCARTQQIPADYHPDTSGWDDLIASDLSNCYYEPGSWVMEDGVLYAEDHSTIWTNDEYQDFIMDLEFRVPEGANSGIFFRTKDRNNVLSALEVQIHATTDGTKHGQCGAIYDLISPSTDATKPAGEWNHYTIRANKNNIYVVLNGEQIIDMDINNWTEPHQNPDGTRHKFDRAIQTQTWAGPIGFQGIHGSAGEPVFFRNLKVKRLD